MPWWVFVLIGVAAVIVVAVVASVCTVVWMFRQMAELDREERAL